MATRPPPTISTVGSNLPSRVIFHGVEGIGKSTLAANASKPVFIMTKHESGLLTLIDNGLVPATSHFDESMTWNDVQGNVRWLIENESPHRTLVLDTLNGAERLCFEHVCAQDFENSWERFLSYGKGPEQSLSYWLNFLSLLDQLRQVRKMAIFCLCHTRVKTFKNPEGDDYDRYSPDMNEKTWGLSHKWADVVLFGNFLTATKKSGLKAKGSGGNQRFLYTQRTAAYDAKNRVGLPPMIQMGTTGAEAWSNLKAAMVEAKKRAAEQNAASSVANGNGNQINGNQPVIVEKELVNG